MKNQKGTQTYLEMVKLELNCGTILVEQKDRERERISPCEGLVKS